MILPSFVVLACAAASAFSSSLPLQKRQCQATLNTAVAVSQSLQSHYFVASSGMYTGGSLWTDANAVEDLHNLMLATGTDEFADLGAQSWIGRNALNNANWDNVYNGANDDALWIVLALWKIGDYKAARGQDSSPYFNAGKTIYNSIAGQWDNSNKCGGGIWWNTQQTYKNAITSELFLLTSAEGSIRGYGGDYLANAQKTWTFLKNSGMRNSDGLWNDGLTDSCANNGQETWTYNQGVVAAGLASLYAATGDASLLTEAEITLDATIRLKTQNGILKESCDDAAAGGAVCNQDQQIFKGLWMKHLQYYLDRANDSARTAKYSSFIGAQESAVYHYGTNSENVVGSVWYAGSQGGSVFTPKTDSSGIAAHVAAAKYGPC